MLMKHEPINGLLICLVRLYEEVSPAPWLEPCLFWTHTHTHTHSNTHTAVVS